MDTSVVPHVGYKFSEDQEHHCCYSIADKVLHGWQMTPVYLLNK